MEVKHTNSRVVIRDQVYDKIQDIRYSSHLKALQSLKSSSSSLKKCNSEYLVNRSNIVEQLDRYKKYQKQVHLKLNPTDVEYKNCLRRLRDIKNDLKLPKITTIKLKENHVLKQDQKHRIQKENEILHNNIAHLSLQKSLKRRQLAKSIQSYQQYRKLSRRIHNKEQKPKLKLNKLQ